MDNRKSDRATLPQPGVPPVACVWLGPPGTFRICICGAAPACAGPEWRYAIAQRLFDVDTTNHARKYEHVSAFAARFGHARGWAAMPSLSFPDHAPLPGGGSDQRRGGSGQYIVPSSPEDRCTCCRTDRPTHHVITCSAGCTQPAGTAKKSGDQVGDNATPGAPTPCPPGHPDADDVDVTSSPALPCAHDDAKRQGRCDRRLFACSFALPSPPASRFYLQPACSRSSDDRSHRSFVSLER